MANNNEILCRLCREAGLGMSQSSDFEVLSQAICDSTGEKLGVNTLKRLFGFKTGRVAPRLSTMNIIARYLGYTDYESLIKDLGEDADISLFTPIDCIEVETLEPGTKLRISYEPKRVLTLTYTGDFVFVVDAVEGSRNILVGDSLTISQFAVGHRLVAARVVRNGENLGSYESAKFEGLKSVEVIA
ncbi:MAG: hypothetical protein K2K52_05165 [Paramuribaculum sp.]|nr:hypothetical protein [Paramuribaculum sp.]